MPTVQDNASSSDASAQQNTSEITDDVITSHPKYKELEEKHSAARTGMDQSNLSKKELQAEVARLKVLAGVEEKTEDKPQEPQYVTKEELKQQAWELTYAKDVELYGDTEYKKDVENGIPREYALNTAKLRYQSNPDKARLDRQQSMASGSAMGVRDISSDELTPTELDGIAQGLYSKETVLKHRELKKARGQL